jgi:hypothetical protein
MTLAAYGHVPKLAEAVRRDAAVRLRANPSDMSHNTKSGTAVEPSAEITVVPNLSACDVNPKYSIFRWHKDWHCVEFRFRLATTAGSSVSGSVDYYLGALLIGQVPIEISVVEGADGSAEPQVLHETADPYQTVFVSYCHEDSEIVNESRNGIRGSRLEILS